MPRFLLNLQRKKNKVLVIMLLLFSTFYICVTILNMKYFSKNKPVLPPVQLEKVVVHLDLKGSPPKLSYLESILPMLKKYGVNGLLIEYEDMFPYEGKLVNLSAGNAYRKDELEDFLRVVLKFGFEIIPLIQTFGHLEHALKLAEFKHLREDPKFADSICPSKKESQELITAMLTQVINFHKKFVPLKHFHIGCDEVFHLNLCNHCQQKNLTKINIFYRHFNFITNIVLNLSPNTTVLFWDDMLREVKPRQFSDLTFHRTVPVYWNYADNLKEIHPTLYKYQQKFKQLWVATAFKGADGPSRTLPKMSNRFRNHWHWMKFIRSYGNVASLYSFKGIILTGWSRYSHMNPPCELLPASIPSLILNLIVIQKYVNGFIVEDDDDEQTFIQKYIKKEFNSALKCQDALNDVLHSFNAQTCGYEASELHTVLQTFIKFKEKYNEKIVSRYDTSIQDFVKIEDFKLGYMDMNYVEELINWFDVALKNLFVIEYSLINIMSDYFDKVVVDEYLFFKDGGMKKETSDFLQFLNNYYNIKEWPPRPFLSYKHQHSTNHD